MSLFETAGQGSYVAANSFMDALARYRRSRGLPALSVNWEPWAEGGMATTLNDQVYQRWERQQVTFIKPQWGVQILEQLLAQQVVGAGVIGLEWQGSPVTDGSLNRGWEFFSKITGSQTDTSLKVTRTPEIETYLRTLVSGWLGVGEAELDMNAPLNRLGVDSISMLELKQRLKTDFRISLNTRQLVESPSLNQLITLVKGDRDVIPAASTKAGWLAHYLPRSEAKVRLFCFHHLGGNASAYSGWENILGPDIEVRPVQLPGREERAAEEFVTSVKELIETLAKELQPYLNDKPFAFYGHSMGALVSLELAHYLKRQGITGPGQLFLGALVPPHRPEIRVDFRNYSPEQLKQMLARYTEDRQTVLEDAEYLDFLARWCKGTQI